MVFITSPWTVEFEQNCDYPIEWYGKKAQELHGNTIHGIQNELLEEFELHWKQRMSRITKIRNLSMNFLTWFDLDEFSAK